MQQSNPKKNSCPVNTKLPGLTNGLIREKKNICRLAKVTLDSLLLSHFGSSHNAVVGRSSAWSQEITAV